MMISKSVAEALLAGASPDDWILDEADPTDVVVFAFPGSGIIANIGQPVQPVSVAFDCDIGNGRLIEAAPRLARTVATLMGAIEGGGGVILAVLDHDPGSAWGLSFPSLPGLTSAADEPEGLVDAATEAMELCHMVGFTIIVILDGEAVVLGSPEFLAAVEGKD